MLTIVSHGIIDMTSSMMTYYTPSYDLGHAPSQPPLCSIEQAHGPDAQSNHSLPQCSDYYRLALHRQYTNSTEFREFPTSLGRAFLISNPGYYVGCVSAQEYHVPGNARLQRLDGVVRAGVQKKNVVDMSTCSRGSAAFP